VSVKQQVTIIFSVFQLHNIKALMN